MPTCNGPGCNNVVRWRVTSAGVAMDRPGGQGPGHLVVPFTFRDMAKALGAVLQADGASITVATKDPPVLCLCPGCWKTKAQTWGRAEGKSAEVYLPARAKTDSNGVHLQVEDPAFNNNPLADRPGNPQMEPIVSCVVHEVMHYWSAGHKGVSAHNREKGVEWDEVFADWMGYLVYRRMFGGKSFPGGNFSKYVGPYGTNAEFLKRATDHWVAQMNIRRIYDPFLTDASKRRDLPRPLRQYFEQHATAAPAGPQPSGVMPPPPPPGSGSAPPPPPGAGLAPPPPFGGMAAPAPTVNHGTNTRDLYRRTIFRYCATWFFSGPTTRIEDEASFQAFIGKKDTIFQKSGTVFTGYAESAMPA